jgi:hypothetical protein
MYKFKYAETRLSDYGKDVAGRSLLYEVKQAMVHCARDLPEFHNAVHEYAHDVFGQEFSADACNSIADLLYGDLIACVPRHNASQLVQIKKRVARMRAYTKDIIDNYPTTSEEYLSHYALHGSTKAHGISIRVQKESYEPAVKYHINLADCEDLKSEMKATFRLFDFLDSDIDSMGSKDLHYNAVVFLVWMGYKVQRLRFTYTK